MVRTRRRQGYLLEEFGARVMKYDPSASLDSFAMVLNEIGYFWILLAALTCHADGCLELSFFAVFVAKEILAFRSCDAVDDGGVSTCVGIGVPWRGVASGGAVMMAACNRFLSVILALRREGLEAVEGRETSEGAFLLCRSEGTRLEGLLVSVPRCPLFAMHAFLPSLTFSGMTILTSCDPPACDVVFAEFVLGLEIPGF